MSKWIVCVLISSMSGSLIFGLWLLLKKLAGKRSVGLLYHTLRAVTVMFALLVLGGFVWSTYLQLYPSSTFWPIETTYIRLFLYLASAFWMSGALYQLFGYVWENVCHNKTVRNMPQNEDGSYEILLDTCRELGIKKVPRLVHSVEAMTPELYGTFRPVIVLPDELLSETEMKHIFVHELFHLKHRDRMFRELAVLVHCIHWFNPLLVKLFDELVMMDEFYCDYCVCGTDFVDRKVYAAILYQFCERAVRHRNLLYVTFAEEGGNMLERMQLIKNYKKLLKNNGWVTALLTVIFVLCGSTIGLAAANGTVDLYSAAVEYTADMVMEEVVTEDGLIEYRVYVGPEYVANMMATSDQVTPNALPTANISTYLRDYWSSGQFYASAGQEIAVNVNMDPANVNIKVGIAEPDGWLRYLYNCGSINHAFQLDKTGSYIVFMRNETDQTVFVTGSYMTRTAY